LIYHKTCGIIGYTESSAGWELCLKHPDGLKRGIRMLVSTKGRYALRVMIDLADHNTGEYITLKDIAERQGISEKYLESIIVVLSKAGLLDGLRGKGGGYRLNRPADEYTLGEILGLVENTLAPVSCLDCGPGGCDCERAVECRTLPIWQNLQSRIDEYLNSVTLAEL